MKTNMKQALEKKMELDNIESEIERLKEKAFKAKSELEPIAVELIEEFASQMNKELNEAGLCLQGEKMVRIGTVNAGEPGLYWVVPNYPYTLIAWGSLGASWHLPYLAEKEESMRKVVFENAKSVAEKREKFIAMLLTFEEALHANPAFSGIKLGTEEKGNPARTALEQAGHFIKKETDAEFESRMMALIVTEAACFLYEKRGQLNLPSPISGKPMAISYREEREHWGIEGGIMVGLEREFLYIWTKSGQTFAIGDQKIELPLAATLSELQIVKEIVEKKKTA